MPVLQRIWKLNDIRLLSTAVCWHVFTSFYIPVGEYKDVIFRWFIFFLLYPLSRYMWSFTVCISKFLNTVKKPLKSRYATVYDLCPWPWNCVLFIVPIDKTEGIQMLYIFVDIKIDTAHFLDTLRHNFSPGTHLALVSTIQFVAALQVNCHNVVSPLSHLILTIVSPGSHENLWYEWIYMMKGTQMLHTEILGCISKNYVHLVDTQYVYFMLFINWMYWLVHVCVICIFSLQAVSWRRTTKSRFHSPNLCHQEKFWDVHLLNYHQMSLHWCKCRSECFI